MDDDIDPPRGSGDEASDAPYLPPAPAVPVPPVVPPHGAPADPTDATTEVDADPALTVADRIAARNVPVVRHDADDAVALAPPPAPGVDPAPGVARAPGEVSAPAPPSDEVHEFVRPELVSLGPSTTALLIGRGLMVVAALLVGIAARRATGVGGSARADRFWPVAASAGVFVIVGVVGLVFWSATVADNARRLKTRTPSPRAMALSWMLPVAWVVLSALTYLRVEVDGDLDPFPGVAGLGFALLLAVPYARLQGIFRRLSRRPLHLFVSGYPLDLAAFGLVWWRLTSWPDPVTASDWDHVRTTSNIAFGAATALALNALVFGWLAMRAGSGVYERLGRLEARSRQGEAAVPEWFVGGLDTPTEAAPVDRRPLIDTRPLTAAVAGLHMLWAVSTVALSVVILRLAFDYDDRAVPLDGGLALDDDDTERLGVVAGAVVLVYAVTIIVHGVWAVITALNARRVTVHSPNPGSFGVLFVPMPVLVVTGLVVGGDVGYVLVVVGLLFALFALLRVNQMLMTLAGRLGGELRGFSRWTLLIGIAYLVGVIENFAFNDTAGRLGFLGGATLAQGVIIGIGAAVGYRAMSDLEETLRTHRQARRAPDE